MKKSIFLILLLIPFSFSLHADEIMSTVLEQKKQVFNEPWFTVNKSHQYLGLGALVLGSLTAILPKPEDEEDGGNSGGTNYSDSLHYKLAMGATYLGGAALGTGFVFHYKDLSFKNFFRNPDNLHAMLATIGTLGFLLAVNGAPADSHATAGVVGLTSMAAAIKITW